MCSQPNSVEIFECILLHHKSKHLIWHNYKENKEMPLKPKKFFTTHMTFLFPSQVFTEIT